MNRSVADVTVMAARMKDGGYRLPSESVAEAIVQETVKKVKKTATNEKPPIGSSDALWSQEQQKLLETAIVKYPKTTAGDRWQKIANTVPGKTKEECLARYRYLVEKVKAQKAKESEANDDADSEKPKNAEDEKEKSAPVETVSSAVEMIQTPEDIEQEYDEPIVNKKAGGKPRNKRKERKKRMDFSSDEDNCYNEES